MVSLSSFAEDADTTLAWDSCGRSCHATRVSRKAKAIRRKWKDGAAASPRHDLADWPTELAWCVQKYVVLYNTSRTSGASS